MTVATGLSQQVYSRLGITAFMQGNRWKRKHLADCGLTCFSHKLCVSRHGKIYHIMRLANANSYTIHMKLNSFSVCLAMA